MGEAKNSSRFSGKERMRCTAPASQLKELKGLVELERRCQDLMQEVQLQSEQSERQDVLGGMVSKRDMQKEAPKNYQENVFEEFLELEEQRAKEALEFVQKKHMLTKVGRRKRNNENVAEIGRIVGDKALE